MTVQEALSTAAGCLRSGQLARAEALCREVLARYPQQADATHLLGLIAHHAGHREAAVGLLERAATLRPRSHEVHRNLGLALASVGRTTEAIAAFRRSIALHPAAATFTSLGNALAAQGQWDEAAVAHGQSVALDPAYAGGHYNLGNALLQMGNVDGAIAAYERAIHANPQFAEAFGNLANALRFKGRLDEALPLYERVTVLQPHAAQAHFNLGIALREKGMREQAIAAFNRAIATDPRLATGHCELGHVLKDSGRPAEAIGAYRRAIELDPNSPEAHSGLGAALQEQGALDEALAAHRRAVAIKPDFAEARNNLGNALKARCQFGEAIAEYRRAIELKPDYAEAYYNLANALHASGQTGLAFTSYNRALAVRPDYMEAHNNLGNALRDEGDLDAAIAAYGAAIAIKPDYADAHSNLGTVLQAMGRYDEAMAAYRRAISLQPDLARGHLNLAILLLLLGDYPNGWAEYDWRWKCVKGATFVEPLWDGEPLGGRTVLLHPEQGFGDTIHFARYAALVAARGGRVVLECQPELVRLLQRLPGVERVVAKGQPRPPFDLHCPLLSLPRIFGTTLESVPAAPSYLTADPDLVAAWKQRLGEGLGLKVGLAWAGSSGHLNDRNRSLALTQLSRLAAIDGVHFFSLQKGPAATQASADPSPLPVTDFDAQLTDFAETAALIANLDLVISVDTSVAHLAAALGKPVWLLLPFVPDWRWLLDREDSPWYPTMRLFRQQTIGDWDEVIARVAEQLANESRGAPAG